MAIREYDTFNELKSADAVAYLLLKEGGKMDYEKLMGLLYLSERECAKEEGEFICNAYLVLTEDGPVLFEVADFIEGETKSEFKYGWNYKINKLSRDSIVSVKRYITEDHLGELSNYFTDIIDDVYKKFGEMLGEELSEYINDTCPECSGFLNESKRFEEPINLNILLKDLGYPPQEIRYFKERLEDEKDWVIYRNNDRDSIDEGYRAFQSRNGNKINEKV